MLTLFVALTLSPAADPTFVAPGEKLEKLWSEGAFTEGPVEGPDVDGVE
jgi:hypothetical protein